MGVTIAIGTTESGVGWLHPAFDSHACKITFGDVIRIRFECLHGICPRCEVVSMPSKLLVPTDVP